MSEIDPTVRVPLVHYPQFSVPEIPAEPIIALPQNVVSVAIYVNNQRTDFYEETGSFERPFKTVAAAIAVAPVVADFQHGPPTIHVASGRYEEDVIIDKPLAIIGDGAIFTLINKVSVQSQSVIIQQTYVNEVQIGDVTGNEVAFILLEGLFCGTLTVENASQARFNGLQIDTKFTYHNSANIFISNSSVNELELISSGDDHYPLGSELVCFLLARHSVLGLGAESTTDITTSDDGVVSMYLLNSTYAQTISVVEDSTIVNIGSVFLDILDGGGDYQVIGGYPEALPEV